MRTHPGIAPEALAVVNSTQLRKVDVSTKGFGFLLGCFALVGFGLEGGAAKAIYGGRIAVLLCNFQASFGFGGEVNFAKTQLKAQGNSDLFQSEMEVLVDDRGYSIGLCYSHTYAAEKYLLNPALPI